MLSFVELDERVFNPFTPEKYSAVQRLSEMAQNVLWITQGASGEEPYANMMHGVARCLLHERSDSRFQIIDFDVSCEPEPKYIAETFLRLHISYSWSQSTKPYAPQWSFEREIYVGKDGQNRIARYKNSIELNQRYNASRRLVKAPLNINESAIEVTSGDSYEVVEHVSLNLEGSDTRENYIDIDVSMSSLNAFKIAGTAFVYLVLGTTEKTGKKLLALTDTLRSRISVSDSQAIALDVPKEQEAAFFFRVANELLADSLLDSASTHGQLVIHNAADALAGTIERRVEEKGLRVILTSEKEQGSFAKVVNTTTPARVMQTIIPRDTTVFLDASSEESPGLIGSKIRKILPARSKVFDLSHVICTHSSPSGNLVSQELKLVLARSCSRAAAGSMSLEPADIEMIPLESVSGLSLSHDPLSVIDWRSNESVPTKVYPPEHYTQFKGDVTYLLVGMTGELGMSLSHWMIERGAKNIALTSRNPNVDERWIVAMKDLGAGVKTFAM